MDASGPLGGIDGFVPLPGIFVGPHQEKVGQLAVRIEFQCLQACLNRAGEVSSPYVIRNQMAVDLDIQGAESSNAFRLSARDSLTRPMAVK